MKHMKSIGCLLAFSIIWVCLFSSKGLCASSMVEKNLFAPDRKPPSPETAVATPQPNKPGLSAKAVQLDGVFIRGDTKKALLRIKGQIPGADRTKAQNPYFSVGEGEKLGDFQVVKIESRSVSIEKEGQTEVINLFAEGKMVVPPPPVPTSPVAPPAPVQPGQAPPPAAPGQVGAQPQLPSTPPGVSMPGVAQPPTAARGPGGHQRIAVPPNPAQFDDNPPPDEEVEVDEEAQ